MKKPEVIETITITLEEYKAIPRTVLALTEIIEKQNEKIRQLEQNEISRIIKNCR